MGGRILTLARVLIERARQERSCRWTRERLRAHQQAQLQRLRRHALRHSRFYQQFHAGLDAAPLEQLPILDKPLMMERFDELVCDPRITREGAEQFLEQDDGTGRYLGRYVVLATSGSTGRRGLFLFDRGEWIRGVASITRPPAWLGSGGGRPPRAAIVASTVKWHYSSRMGAELSSSLAPALRLDAVMPLPQIVAALNDWQPEAMVSYPSMLRELAREALAGRLRIRLRNIASSAERLTEEVCTLAREAFGAHIQDIYGATEYAPIAAECAQGNRHLLEDGAIIESVDAQGRAAGEGELGDRLLITVLRRFTQPLIRYEISDRLAISSQGCECGRPFRIVRAIAGRAEDTLVFHAAAAGANPSSAGITVQPKEFHALLERAGIDAWQVEGGEDALLVRVQGSGADPLREQLRREIGDALARLGAAPVTVTVQWVERIPRGISGKAPLVVATRRG